MCVLQWISYSLLVHSVTVTCRRPIAKGSPARSRSRRLRPADALLARSLPGGRICHMVAGLPVARLACSLLATRQRLGRLAPAWLPDGRKGAGIPTLSCAPTRPERGTYCSGVHSMVGADLNAPRSETV